MRVITDKLEIEKLKTGTRLSFFKNNDVFYKDTIIEILSKEGLLSNGDVYFYLMDLKNNLPLPRAKVDDVTKVQILTKPSNIIADPLIIQNLKIGTQFDFLENSHHLYHDALLEILGKDEEDGKIALHLLDKKVKRSFSIIIDDATEVRILS